MAGATAPFSNKDEANRIWVGVMDPAVLANGTTKPDRVAGDHRRADRPGRTR